MIKPVFASISIPLGRFAAEYVTEPPEEATETSMPAFTDLYAFTFAGRSKDGSATILNVADAVPTAVPWTSCPEYDARTLQV